MSVTLSSALRRQCGVSSPVEAEVFPEPEPPPAYRFVKRHWTVYALKSHQGEHLYIGCTSDLYKRCASHSQKPWWSEVGEVKVMAFINGKAPAFAIESHLIKELQPVYNIAGK